MKTALICAASAIVAPRSISYWVANSSWFRLIPVSQPSFRNVPERPATHRGGRYVPFKAHTLQKATSRTSHSVLAKIKGNNCSELLFIQKKSQ
jgi:hypothetical protein